jgi:hypothetical protein
MADFDFGATPGRRRVEFADGNWYTFSFPRSAKTIDVVFEDTSGKSVYGYLAPGFLLVGAPAVTDAKAASYSWVGGDGPALPYLSVALAAGHYVSVVIT